MNKSLTYLIEISSKTKLKSKIYLIFLNYYFSKPYNYITDSHFSKLYNYNSFDIFYC